MKIHLSAHFATDVYLSEGGYVCIAQDTNGEVETVAIHQDQLEYLILTLNEFMPGGNYHESYDGGEEE